MYSYLFQGYVRVDEWNKPEYSIKKNTKRQFEEQKDTVVVHVQRKYNKMLTFRTTKKKKKKKLSLDFIKKHQTPFSDGCYYIDNEECQNKNH